MARKDTSQVWISVDFRKSETDISGVRGRVAAATFDALMNGTMTVPWFKVSDVYWFADRVEEPDEDEEWRGDSEKGVLVRYGDGVFSHFTGDLWLRVDSVVSLAILKDGSERDDELEEDF